MYILLVQNRLSNAMIINCEVSKKHDKTSVWHRPLKRDEYLTHKTDLVFRLYSKKKKNNNIFI